MDSGFLVYKCRRCGKLNKSIHVPDGTIALSSAINNIQVPEVWGYSKIKLFDMCCCEDGNLGVTDLIGFEKVQ